MPKNWNRRFKHNRDKMKTGDILELAEVVRNLSLRDSEKGLSTGEKQMFVKAKKILASELMYAKDMDEEEAAEWLDGVLVGSAEASTNGRKKNHRGEARQGCVQDLSKAGGPQDRGETGGEGQAKTKAARLLEVKRLGSPRCRGSGDRLGADRSESVLRVSATSRCLPRA